MIRFKVGDRVQLDSSSLGLSGKKGIVRRIIKKQGAIGVQIKDLIYGHDLNGFLKPPYECTGIWVDEESLKLVERDVDKNRVKKDMQEGI